MSYRSTVLGLISCFTLNAVISSVATIDWIYQTCCSENDEIQKSLQKALLRANWLCIVSMWFASTILAIYSIVIASSDGIESIGSDAYDVSKSSSIGVLLVFYFFGKYALYYTLYLRLFHLLTNTIFQYHEKVYKKIKILIGISFSALFLAAICTMISNGISLFFVFSLIYVLLDFVIPIYINVLFIRKLRQVTKFCVSRMRGGSENSSIKTNCRKRVYSLESSAKVKPVSKLEQTDVPEQPNSNNVDNLKLAKDVKDPIANKVGSSNVNGNNIITNEKAAPTIAYNPNIVVNIDSSEQIEKTLAQKSDDLYFLQIVWKNSILATFIGVSSLAFFITLIVRVVYVSTNSYKEGVISTMTQWLALSIDCMINIVCLLLYFSFADNLAAILTCTNKAQCLIKHC